ncbi:hypothetical protein E8E13_005315 [Curvularia kusanoi]|uniref:Rhodopsin domain-containing protein n=1 Tax=Curvularia kusanoi TaxID=90978 RepID=A0A9P4WBC1_CURKU|nr:hypothetical protein E8E13_005315 [Curvularia kusanoi]
MSAPMENPQLSAEYLAADKGGGTLVLITLFPALALITVGLRLYTRFNIVRIPSHEDYAIALAMVLSIGCMTCQTIQVHNGVGRHIQSLTVDQIISSFKVSLSVKCNFQADLLQALWASIYFYNVALSLTKISIALQYLRLTTEKPIYRICWVFIWFTAAFCIVALFVGTFQCAPVAKFWNMQIPGKCINKTAWYYVTAAISIVQDILLVILPFFILRRLAMPAREKASLMVILGLGGVAAIASICRLYALYVISVSADITWDSPASVYWSAIELNVGILCASLPTLRPFLARIWPSAFISSLGSQQVGASSKNRSGGQYYNMEGSIMM